MKYFLRAEYDDQLADIWRDGPHYYSKFCHSASIRWSPKISNAILFDSVDEILELKANYTIFGNSVIESKTEKELFELKLRGL